MEQLNSDCPSSTPEQPMQPSLSLGAPSHMTTPGGPTGVSSATGPALSADTLEQIGYIVAPFADRAAVQAFLNSLNTLVKGYAAQKEVYEQSLPKTVRNNLAKAREAAQMRVSRDREHGFHRIVSMDFRRS